ncbi:MAG: hypothetical protein CVU60_05885 [Deltaproteobacteria bacterium HGW-Deltaproteobacteria-18]|jgi:hypothetical protein|nr:MAG: hypothetical protein CVU60_05885 [Deltaproteobacteria bacterium HGW-Deltaproteobacteria-18]
MSKDTMISFRTTEEFSKSLKKFAKKNKVTLSGFIDAVLQDFLQSQAGQDILLEDRRRFPRQHKAIPAIISGQNGAQKYFHASKITNLSLGGINLVVPKNGDGCNLADQELDSFDVVFALPQEERPITIQCQGKRVFQTSDCYQVGASFDDTDLDSYQALQSYLY